VVALEEVREKQLGPPPVTYVTLTATVLYKVTHDIQKDMIGQDAYHFIRKLRPDLGGKITGMFLEWDKSKLFEFSRRS